jgi:hypothetical protein
MILLFERIEHCGLSLSERRKKREKQKCFELGAFEAYTDIQ